VILPDLIFIIFLIDRVGRRKPLLWGTIGITIALICEAIVNSQINTEAPQNGLSIAGVFFLFCVTVIFSRKFFLGTLRKRHSLLGTDILGLHGRSNAHANPRPRECLRDWNRELACEPPLLSLLPPFPTSINNTQVSTFWAQVSPTALKALTWKFYFLFVAWNIVVTFPIVFFFFKETKQVSLEDIDLLFGERVLGTLPDDLHKAPITEPLNEMESSPVATDTEAKPKVEGEAV
jgi:hypothetical protein